MREASELKSFLCLVTAAIAAACSSNSSSHTGANRQFDDASTSTGGASTGGGPSSGGDSSLDAGSLDSASVDACDNGIVTKVTRSRAPASSAEAGAPNAIRRVDGGFVFATPTDPCVTYRRPDCPGAPRSMFGCPSVVGPNGNTAIHPGDHITVKVPITDEGAYSCKGLDAEEPIAGGSERLYDVSPAYVELSGQIPTSTKPGTVYHFTAAASGSRYAAGTACENDLTRLDFGVTVE